MRNLIVPILFCVALAEAGCRYSEEKLPDCWTENIAPSVKALSRLPSMGGPETTIQHSLCSTDTDRLNRAERALSSSGLSHSRYKAELGECVDVDIRGQVSASAITKQVENICTISAATRVAYTHWSGSIGGHFVFVHGNYISVNGSRQMP